MSDSSRLHEHESTVKLNLNSGKTDARGLRPASDSGRTVLVGLLGGIASAVGYAVYQRLPEDQRDRVNEQVRGLVANRLNEFKSSFNL